MFFFLRWEQKLSMGASVMAGGLTGICYWLSCYPIDVVKNRIMVHFPQSFFSLFLWLLPLTHVCTQAAPDVSPPVYRNMRDAAMQLYRREGLRGFYTGFTPCLLRAFPANAACFVGTTTSALCICRE
jgi:solute carrier family 25 carnitine/acylcarnitine transporter 20/29